MKQVGIIGLVLACCLMSSCQVLEKKQQVGAAVELNGHYLYRSTLDSLTLGLSSEDSACVADQYIEQWAKDMLMYDVVESGKSKAKSKEIEALVNDYRRSLYVHAYEEYLIERNMPKEVEDSVAELIYTRMKSRFKLNESIVKGLLVVVPNDAPNLPTLRKWLTNKMLDEIEKYAYQYANGYDLFNDKWLTTTDLIYCMPIDRGELENRLKTKDQIEVSDSLKTYMLQITDKHLRGEQMPIDYARPEIEKIVLSGRQVEFLQNERERLYEEALIEQKIKFYE